jgi:hypothetical protein
MGHPEFERWIITSPIVEMVAIKDSVINFECETMNSIYHLVGPEQTKEVPCPKENYAKYGIGF